MLFVSEKKLSRENIILTDKYQIIDLSAALVYTTKLEMARISGSFMLR